MSSQQVTLTPISPLTLRMETMIPLRLFLCTRRTGGLDELFLGMCVWQHPRWKYVEGYITNGTINLAQGSQVDGNAILTSIDQLDWNNCNIPGDLADGDNDTVGAYHALMVNTPAFDANAGSWVCVGNAGSGGVVVGTYVGDGNSSQNNLPQLLIRLRFRVHNLGSKF